MKRAARGGLVLGCQVWASALDSLGLNHLDHWAEFAPPNPSTIKS
jgi:hypothetical protein